MVDLATTNLIQNCDLSNFFAASLENLIRFKSFFTIIYSNAKKTIVNNTNDFERLPLPHDMNDMLNQQTSQQAVSNLYMQTQIYFEETNYVLDQIYDQLVSPLDLFCKNVSKIYKENVAELFDLSQIEIKAKRSVESAKKRYYDAADKAELLEYKLKTFICNKDNYTTAELTKYHDQILQARAMTENNCDEYKQEITRINQIKIANNAKYIALQIKIKANEEARIAVMKEVLKKYAVLISSFKKVQQRLEDNIIKLSGEINIGNDFKIITQSFESLKREIKPTEKYEKYEEYQSNNFNGDLLLEEEQNDDKFRGSSLIENRFFSEFEVISDDPMLYSDTFQNTIMSEYINDLLKKENVEGDKVCKIMELLNKDKIFTRTFLNHFINKQKEGSICIPNYNNLLQLAAILNSVCLNIEQSKEDLNIIYYTTFKITEKIFCTSGELQDIVYLCAILSKSNQLYSMKSFWKDIILAQFKQKVEARLDKLIKVEGFKPKKDSKTDVFEIVGYDKISSIKEKNDRQCVLETSGLSLKVKNYSCTPGYLIPYLENYAINDLFILLQEFVIYFSLFNLSMTDSTELIGDLCKQFNINKDRQIFLTKSIVSWNHTTKKILKKNSSNSIGINLKIDDIKKKQYDLINFKHPVPSSIENATIKDKLLAVCLITPFLPEKEFLHSFILNKKISIKGKKKIMKSYFKMNKKVSLDTRLHLWFVLLNVGNAMKKYNYEIIKKDALTELCPRVSELISLDVQRTTFPIEDDYHKIIFSNILNTIAHSKPNSNYCQGMNYITSFLLQLLNYKEDSTFYFMIALFEEMKYDNMFLPKLSKLNSAFFTLERLIALYLPELHEAFKARNINVNFFCPPWFLTIFTNATPSIDRNDPPLILLDIWTNFFISGWKALMIPCLVLLKNFKEEILQLNNNETLTYIINHVSLDTFLLNKTTEDYYKLSSTIKIPRVLVSNLEAEYEAYEKFN